MILVLTCVCVWGGGRVYGRARVFVRVRVSGALLPPTPVSVTRGSSSLSDRLEMFGGGSIPAVLQRSSVLRVKAADIPVLEMKLGALLVLLCATLLFGLAPLALAGWFRLGPGERARMPSLISCFAGGVFLATCLLGLLPDYLQSIDGAFSSAGITVRLEHGPSVLDGSLRVCSHLPLC